jgi:hypothetical protein
MDERGPTESFPNSSSPNNTRSSDDLARASLIANMSVVCITEIRKQSVTSSNILRDFYELSFAPGCATAKW